jgi:hypothetical protein
MSNAILTLQLPKGNRGIPVATTSNPDVLRAFRHAVIADAQSKLETAEDEVERLLAQLELERLMRALAVLIPESESFGLPGVQ